MKKDWEFLIPIAIILLAVIVALATMPMSPIFILFPGLPMFALLAMCISSVVYGTLWDEM